MKKTLILSLILGSILFPSFSMAQTVDSPATSAQIDDLKSTLISLLTQMIASLQAQINQILAQQSQAVNPTPVVVPSIGGADTTQEVATEPLKIDQFQFQVVNDPIWQLDVVTNKPIDPTITQIDGQTIAVTDIKTLPASVYGLPDDYRVRFNTTLEASTTPVIHMTVFGSDGTSVTRDLHYVGPNSVSNYRN